MTDWKELLDDPTINDDISNAIWNWEQTHHDLPEEDASAIAEMVAQGIIDWYDLTGKWRSDYDTLVELYSEED